MNTLDLIKAYYDAFNRRDREAMLALMSDDVVHDLNQGARESGREAFRLFLARMDRCYEETLRDVVVMTISDPNASPRMVALPSTVGGGNASSALTMASTTS